MDYSYSYFPYFLPEYPAIGHDRRYDKLGIKGAAGLFLDPRSIGADWQFVMEELTIASNPLLDFETRWIAGFLGMSLGACAMPKSIFILYTFDIKRTIEWYNISDEGVNNAPVIHKH